MLRTVLTHRSSRETAGPASRSGATELPGRPGCGLDRIVDGVAEYIDRYAG
jgi:hypothetical protein